MCCCVCESDASIHRCSTVNTLADAFTPPRDTAVRPRRGTRHVHLADAASCHPPPPRLHQRRPCALSVLALPRPGPPPRPLVAGVSSGVAPADPPPLPHVQPLNTLPFVMTMANCICWASYAFLIDNWYLAIFNSLGFLIGLFLFLMAYGVGVPDVHVRDRVHAVCVIDAVVLFTVTIIERMVITSQSAREQLWGYAGALTQTATSSSTHACPAARAVSVLTARPNIIQTRHDEPSHVPML